MEQSMRIAEQALDLIPGGAINVDFEGRAIDPATYVDRGKQGKTEGLLLQPITLSPNLQGQNREAARRVNTADKRVVLPPKENAYGVKFSEIHAIDLVDMDGDGLKDIVTGKRFWSHGRTGDPDRNDDAVLYWFKLVRGKDGSVDFVPHLIDKNSGVGVQVVAADIDGDTRPDIVVGNKKGAFVHLQVKPGAKAK
jgi:hypothetical protein